MGRLKLPFRHLLKTLLFNLCMFVLLTLLPIFFLVSYIVRCVAVLLCSYDPDYGKFLIYTDACLDEDYVPGTPKLTIVTTINLQDNIPSIQEFRQLFRQNVLEATLPAPASTGRVLRYPEFQQYIAPYWGFRVWKKDRDFRIEELILEKQMDERVNVSEIHEELINKPFQDLKSPWEIVLYSYHDHEDSANGNTQTCSKKCVVGFRIHHSMADVRSILKCFVECLGQKELKTSEPSRIERTATQLLQNCISFPIKCFRVVLNIQWYSLKFHIHPWKTLMNSSDPNDPTSDRVHLVVRISTKLQLGCIKRIAKENGVLASSVILSIIAGAIGQCDIDDGEIYLAFPQPRENHPAHLANHMYTSIIVVPTSRAKSALSRLSACHRQIMEVKRAEMGRFADSLGFMSGYLFTFLRRKVAINYFLPLGITNIAGELEGFSIGESKCQDYIISVGPAPGASGVTFCAFSYQDGIRVAVVGKEKVMSGLEAEQTALNIEYELRALLERSK